MLIAELPSVEELKARMRGVCPLPLTRNTFYRDSPVAAYSLYGTGPLHGLSRGARYSPPEAFPVLYFAADRLQAQLEAAHHLNRRLPKDPGDQIRELHKQLSSFDVGSLLAILQEMASSEEGYVENAQIQKYLDNPVVRGLFSEDPAKLQVFLELAPDLHTPLRCLMDSSRISLSVNITARGVLNLLDPSTLEILKIEKEDLLVSTDSWQNATSDTWTLPQRLGLAAWDAPGIDGILAPSALAEKNQSALVLNPVNLVLFMHEKENHLPRSNSVKLDTEEEFVRLTKLFWVHRPQWLLDALDKFEPDAADVLRKINKRSQG